jgi:hypothetical protein
MKKPANKKFMRLLSKLNLSKWIASHLIGKNHSIIHRQITGIAIMIFGVGLAKLFGELSIDYVRFFGDILGYGLHGIGLIPFVHTIELVE